MKELSKKIWISKLTIIITCIQVTIPIIGGKDFFKVSFVISLFINIIATILLNYSINWLYNKNNTDSGKKYKKEAPCTFQAIKFMMGIIISIVLVGVDCIHRIDGINIAKMICFWFFLPLLLLFTTCVLMDVGFYDKIPLSQKVYKIPQFIKKTLSYMFDYNQDGKMIFSVKSIFNTVVFLCYIIVIILYVIITFISSIINI